MSSPYKLLETLHEEVRTNLTLHPQISSLIQLFLKYLKEPRYQSPLTVEELSHLFNKFYQDLNVLAIGIISQSNTTKKQLISNCQIFNQYPKNFDYLLAIANYSTSSIKLLKRSDDDALYQLRVFNYYKFLIIFESINLAQLELFNSINIGDDVTLYDKIFKFDQKDIIYQEFFDDKLSNLKKLNLSFRLFIDHDVGDQERLVEVMDNIQPEEILALQENLLDLQKMEKNPYSKLISIVKLHKNLIKLFIDKGFENKQINNDLLLPSLIYLLIYKLENEELCLNFLFIKNFLNVLDSKDVELYNLNLNSSYNPNQERLSPPSGSSKIKRGNIFELLNLFESQDQPQTQDFINDDAFKFFTNDKDLITYLNHEFLNTGELHFYLTNFEAIIEYLANCTISELCSKEEEDLTVDSETKKLKILNVPISNLVEEELLSHFQFPDGTLQEEIQRKEEEEKQQQQQVEKSRSRSSSLINTITNRLNDSRMRSNSSLKQEIFPSLGSEESSEGTGLSMMRNILGRFSSASSSGFPQVGSSDTNQETQRHISPERRSNSLLNKVAPTHSRTRSSSLEAAVNNPFVHSKRNSITSKFASGVTEFMTKLNNQQQQQIQSIPNLQPGVTDSNNSNSSLQSLDNGYSNGSNTVVDVISGSSTVVPKPEAGRSRTTSLQILDKWFNNLNANATAQQQLSQNASQYSPITPAHQKVRSYQLPTNHEEPVSVIDDVQQLTKYHNIDFENLSIKQLRELKVFYDQFCFCLLSNNNESGKHDSGISLNDKSPSRNNSLDKLMAKFDTTDLNSKAESIDSNEKIINGNTSASL
ncbi:hypothetical protein JA1_004214 [Spathaspora sp. JA1]|nr:hypothetical protein JA1_004214 [Spathaspora sp. JA1]